MASPQPSCSLAIAPLCCASDAFQIQLLDFIDEPLVRPEVNDLLKGGGQRRTLALSPIESMRVRFLSTALAL